MTRTSNMADVQRVSNRMDDITIQDLLDTIDAAPKGALPQSHIKSGKPDITSSLPPTGTAAFS